ncbi:MAG: DUF1028 domain-containing protein [Actinomycetota bacterium]
MTFSICAVDRATGDVGAAATTKFLAVGAGVLWAEVGVGAVCTQALARTAYGPELLDLLRGGASAEAAITQATAADEGREDRQLGAVAADGAGATYTGGACFDWAGGRVLADATVQGNILAGPGVVDAMAAAWADGAGGPLEMRLMSVLHAGEAAGGDRRGRQSAALLVRRGDGTDPVDLRVDDHPEPLAELERLHAAYRLVYETAPPETWTPVDAALAGRIRTALARAGYATDGDGPWDAALEQALAAWAFDENLDGRWAGGDRVDPAVLQHLLA